MKVLEIGYVYYLTAKDNRERAINDAVAQDVNKYWLTPRFKKY